MSPSRVSRGRARTARGSTGPGVRISAGELRGRRLAAGVEVRPTEARVREALIDRWRPRLASARVLDLFSGTGAVGFHALSCGAASCAFVDREPRHLEAIRRSAGDWELRDRVECVTAELPGELAGVRGRLRGPFDLVFADPPYAYDRYPELIERAVGLLSAAGEIAVEHRASVCLPESVGSGVVRAQRFATRRYGECRLSFYRPTDAAPCRVSGEVRAESPDGSAAGESS